MNVQCITDRVGDPNGQIAKRSAAQPSQKDRSIPVRVGVQNRGAYVDSEAAQSTSLANGLHADDECPLWAIAPPSNW